MKFKEWLENKLLEQNYSQQAIRRLVYSYANRKPGSQTSYYAPGLITPAIGQALFAGIKPAEFDVATPISQFMQSAREKSQQQQDLQATSLTMPLQLPSLNGADIGIRTTGAFSKQITNGVMRNIEEWSKHIRHFNDMQDDPNKFDLLIKSPKSDDNFEINKSENFTKGLAIVTLWALNKGAENLYDLLNPRISASRTNDGQLNIRVDYDPIRGRNP